MRHVMSDVAVLVVVLSSVGCSTGNADSDKVASLESERPNVAASPELDQVEAYLNKYRDFAQCIRDAGYPDMPDPDAQGGFPRTILQNLDGDDAQIYQGCYPIIKGLPVPAELQSQRDEATAAKLTEAEKRSYVEHAKCMQQNGVPEYPDPEPNGLQPLPPWDLPDATASRPPGVDAAARACRDIIDSEQN